MISAVLIVLQGKKIWFAKYTLFMRFSLWWHFLHNTSFNSDMQWTADTHTLCPKAGAVSEHQACAVSSLPSGLERCVMMANQAWTTTPPVLPLLQKKRKKTELVLLNQWCIQTSAACLKQVFLLPNWGTTESETLHLSEALQDFWRCFNDVQYDLQ